MDDVVRSVLIVVAVLLGLFLAVVGLLMWRFRIPPRGLVALTMAGFYLLVPVDVVPEAVLGPLGLVDDAGVVGVALLFALRLARARRVLVGLRPEARSRLSGRRRGGRRGSRRGGRRGSRRGNPALSEPDLTPRTRRGPDIGGGPLTGA